MPANIKCVTYQREMYQNYLMLLVEASYFPSRLTSQLAHMLHVEVIYDNVFKSGDSCGPAAQSRSAGL